MPADLMPGENRFAAEDATNQGSPRRALRACTDDSVTERFLSPFANRMREARGLRNVDARPAGHRFDQPGRCLRGARRGAEPPKEYQEP